MIKKLNSMTKREVPKSLQEDKEKSKQKKSRYNICEYQYYNLKFEIQFVA